MSRITEKTKCKEGRGSGFGADYKPWTLAREVGSNGTSSVFNDWKHGRQIQCLSQCEEKAYYLLRWRDDVVDIREQFPLDLNLTRAIARRLGLPHPHNRNTRMTTDFLVTFQNPDGKYYMEAYNIKANRDAFDQYALKNFAIEQAYWNIKGIKIEVILADNLNIILYSNIKQCMPYYNASAVQSKVDIIKHLIARKLLVLDMETDYLNIPKISEEFFKNKENIKWLNQLATKQPLLKVE